MQNEEETKRCKTARKKTFDALR